MKTIKLLIAILFVAGLTSSQAQNIWTQKTDFGGNARYAPVGFSIGSKGYIGTGVDGNNIYYKDFWEYDPATNAWTQKADFGGTARHAAVGFSIGSKGYLGTGYNNGTVYKDFWEYDPAANIWIRKADFEGAARWFGVGFSIGSKGYIGTGEDKHTTYKDFWEYDPAANTWAQKADFGGTTRLAAAGFSIGSKGYIGTGLMGSSDYYKDFWEYDPATDAWTRKADFGGTIRYSAFSFSIGTKGYLGMGDEFGPYLAKDFWEYDPAANTWTQKGDFGGTVRYQGASFSIGSKGYVGLGIGYSSLTFKDFWEYTPEVTTCNPPTDLKVISTTDSSAKLGWTLPGSSSVGLIIHYHPAGSNAWREKIPGAGAMHVVLKNLLPNTTYKWQIRSVCSDKLSGWAKGPDFTTTSAFALSSTKISDALNGGNFGISISPNPVTGNVLNLHITNATATNIQLGIADMQGRIFITQNVSSNGGSLNKVIDVSAIPKGIYILKIISNKNEQRQIKFVKAN